MPFTEIQMEIHDKCPEEYTTLIMRRFMMRIAEKVARQENSAGADYRRIGRAGRQSDDGRRSAATDMVVDMPVFRPLIGFDKEEIIAVSAKNRHIRDVQPALRGLLHGLYAAPSRDAPEDGENS